MRTVNIYSPDIFLEKLLMRVIAPPYNYVIFLISGLLRRTALYNEKNSSYSLVSHYTPIYSYEVQGIEISLTILFCEPTVKV